MTPALTRYATRLRDFLARPVLDALDRSPRGPDAATQLQLHLEYRRLIDEGRPLPKLADVGFQAYSQTDEDGILLFLSSVLRVDEKVCVEICAGDGRECNTANLIINRGWHGLLVDGDAALVERGRRMYAGLPSTYVYPPRFVQAWITRDNVNALLTANGFEHTVGVLSLDLDGVDYWIWDAIDVIQPRIVVVEYQDILGPERSWTVPYSEQFSAAAYPMTQGMPNFSGASLTAFVKLGRRKGYRLVGVNRYGYNAFFVMNGLADHVLPEVAVADCFGHPKVIWGMRERFPQTQALPWVEV